MSDRITTFAHPRADRRFPPRSTPSGAAVPVRSLPPGFRAALGAVLLVAVVASLVATPAAIGLASPLGPSAVPAAPAFVPLAAPHAAVAPSPAAPSALTPTYPSSGRGIFFNTTQIPMPTVGNLTCFYSPAWCYNVTAEPSMNFTTNGVLALAYTALTNTTGCPGFATYTVSEVGFTYSLDNGTTWSSPMYLGNPDCSSSQVFADAWEPALTSLANGTLVMVYLEYNWTWVGGSASYSGPYVPPFASCYGTPYSRLVFTQSFDNGTTWSDPVALNNSSNPSVPYYCSDGTVTMRPSIATSGSNIYVAWENVTNRFTEVESHLMVSHDNGSSWGAQENITPIQAYDPNAGYGSYGYWTNISENPSLAVTPNGTLLLAYATNRTNAPVICYYVYYCDYDLENESIMLAVSTDNGSTFTSHIAASGAQVYYSTQRYDDPTLLVAYNPLYDQTYIVYNHGTYLPQCYYYGCYPDQFETMSFVNSSNLGASWSASKLLTTRWSNPANATGSLYNPAIAVSQGGVVNVAFTVQDNTLCGPVVYSYYSYTQCGAPVEYYLNSTDNGTTWTAPVLVWNNYTPFESAPYQELWGGEVGSMVAYGNHLWLAWDHMACPDWNNTAASSTYCYYPGNIYDSDSAIAQVVVSEPYTGTGISLTFHAVGLKASDNWTLNVNGNVRGGNGTTNLTVSGIPPSLLVGFSVPWVNVSYGHTFESLVPVASPSTFSKNTTINVTFTEYWLLNLGYNPSSIGSCIYYVCSTLTIVGGTGALWLPANATYPLNLTTNTPACCSTFFLTTFVGWSGFGASAVNTHVMNTTLTMRSQVNETLNLRISGLCVYDYLNPPTYESCGQLNYSLSFAQTGLPAGVDWGATVAGIPASTTNATLNVTVPGGSTDFTVWTVPDPSVPGSAWVPTVTAISPVWSPHFAPINVSFALTSLASASFGTTFSESGLPAGSSWTISVGGTSYGIAAMNWSTTLSGGTYALNASTVTTGTGTSYYLAGIQFTPYMVNGSTQALGGPSYAMDLASPALVTFSFAPEYLVSVSATVGGTAGPASTWVPSGRNVTLTETPEAGYYFAGWTGSGSGATTGLEAHNATVTVAPGGPVSEVAVFSLIPPPHWQVNVTAVGIPSSQAYTVDLGPYSFSGSGSFAITNMSTAWYALSVPYVYANGSAGTRYVLDSVGGSFAIGTNGSGLLDANTSLVLTFGTQYTLTLSSGPNGSVSASVPGPWIDASTVVTVTATPGPHFGFAGWNASGAGSVGGTAASINVTMNGPISESATFAYVPTLPPMTYQLVVNESGLPTGEGWSLSTGSNGASGTAASLTVHGLNGSYSIAIPDVYVGTGTRYVPDNATLSLSVAGNMTANVVFSEEFYVTVTSGNGGAATPGSGWVAAGGSVTLTATPSSSDWTFANWTNSGTHAVVSTSSSYTLTVSGPTTLSANFAPVAPPAPKSTSSSGNAPSLMAWVALVALLVVGAIVGVLLGRRRSPPREPVQPADVPAADAPASYDEGNP